MGSRYHEDWTKYSNRFSEFLLIRYINDTFKIEFVDNPLLHDICLKKNEKLPLTIPLIRFVKFQYL